MDKIKYSLDPHGYAPTRAHAWDAGWDLRAPRQEEPERGYWMPSRSAHTFDTGVHVEIPEGYVGMVKAKSGLNVNKGLTCTGVVDAGYSGSIRVKLYNHSFETVRINQGDKIAQLVIMPICTAELVEVDEIAAGERGDNGFGSTGR